MPVRVDVPIRVRTDPRALEAIGDGLAASIRAAARRALATSRTEVLEPRGALARPLLHGPSTVWLGDGLADVPAALRARVEDAVAEALRLAAEDAGFGAALSVREPRPLGGRSHGERPDDARYDRALSLYSLPSYEGGAPVNVPVQPSAPGPGRHTELVWSTVDPKTWRGAFWSRLEEFGLSPPESGYLGAIFPWNGRMLIQVLEFPTWELVADLGVDVLFDDVYDEGLKAWTRRPASFPAEAGYELTWIAEAGAGALEPLRREYTPLVLRELSRHRGPLVSSAEFEQSVAARVDALVAELTSRPDTRCYARLDIGAIGYLVRLPFAIPQQLQRVRLVPIAELAEVADEPAATDGATTGAGAPGGAVSTAAGDAPPVAFPPAPGERRREAVTCAAYLGEPSTKQLGKAGERMQELIERIAAHLQITSCEYAGGFLLAAAEALGARAESSTAWEIVARPHATAARPDGKGNLGYVQYTPAASPPILFMRHLATVTPLCTELQRWIEHVYQAEGERIEGVWSGRPLSWLLRFLYELNRRMGQAVGQVFAFTCRLLFLELLDASALGIAERLRSIDAFAAHFKQTVLPQLETLDELVRLRELVKIAKDLAWLARNNPAALAREYPDVAVAASPRPLGPRPARRSSWKEATEGFAEALAGQPAAPVPASGTIEVVPELDGSYRIVDRRGRVWDLDALETQITLRRGAVEAIEPLVKQFTDLPEVMQRIRAAGWDVTPVLRDLLEQMQRKNAEIRGRAKTDPLYGFRASRISPCFEAATVPYTKYQLGGVHLEAHRQIGEFFRGDRFYAIGIEHLFGVELGGNALAGVAEFTGLVLLAVLCPPVGMGLGIVLATYHYEEARGRQRVYGSLLDPDRVLTQAEVEIELFAAELGLALSFLPVAGELLGELGPLVRGAARAGAELEAGAAAARTAGVSRATAQLLRLVEKGIVETLARDLALAFAIQKAFQISLEPVLASIEREVRVTGSTGGLEGALNELLHRNRQRRLAKGSAG